MKAKRLLFLVMAICLASEIKAQFYDGPDDIYYYVVESRDGRTVSKQDQDVYVFNFDGRKACQLAIESVKKAQEHLAENPDYFNAMIETKKYEMEYSSSYTGVCYVWNDVWTFYTPAWGNRTVNQTNTYIFSRDRESLTLEDKRKSYGPTGNGNSTTKYILRKVDKSYFKVGRSRTPSGTMYE